MPILCDEIMPVKDTEEAPGNVCSVNKSDPFQEAFCDRDGSHRAGTPTGSRCAAVKSMLFSLGVDLVSAL